MTKRKILAISTIATTLLAAGCGGSSKPAATTAAPTTAAGATATSAAAPAAAKRADMLTLGTIAKIVDYSSAAGEYGNRVNSYQAVYDSLLYAKPDGTVVPNLATEWKYSPDNLTLTLKLRTDVTFHDGTKFDAAAAAANLNRYKTGKAPSASNLTLMDKATAIDPATLEIKMTDSDPAMLAYLARDSALMQSPATFGGAKEKTVPVGTGPYILDEAKTVPDTTYVYKANPKYWAPERIKYENLTIKVIEDPAAALNAIKAGEVNAMNLINNDALKEVTGAGFTLVPVSSTGLASPWSTRTVPWVRRSRTSRSARPSTWRSTARACWPASALATEPRPPRCSARPARLRCRPRQPLPIRRSQVQGAAGRGRLRVGLRAEDAEGCHSRRGRLGAHC